MLQSERFSSSTQDIDVLTYAVWEAENNAVMQALADSFADPAEEVEVEEVKVEPPPPLPPPADLSSLQLASAHHRSPVEARFIVCLLVKEGTTSAIVMPCQFQDYVEERVVAHDGYEVVADDEEEEVCWTIQVSHSFCACTGLQCISDMQCCV